MAEFKIGDRVHVEFDAVIKNTPIGNYVEVDTPNYSALLGHGHFLVHCQHVTLLDPEGWPPQVGDIWEVESSEFSARAQTSGIIVLDSTDNRIDGRFFGYIKGDLTDFLALNPRLVRRRGREGS